MSTDYYGNFTDLIQVTTNSSTVDTLSPSLVATNSHLLAGTRFVVQKLLVPVITSVGLCGNMVSIRVLTHQSMVSSTNCYLTALAIFDVLYLMFSFTLSLKHYDAIKLDAVYNYWYPFGRVLTDICGNVSVCLTVTFSLERLVAVSYPMRGRILCTPKRARLITAIVVVFAVACTSPEFFETDLVVRHSNNRTIVQQVPSKMAETDGYRIGYYNFFVFTFTILPLILLCTSNGILVKTVFAAMKIRKRMVYTALRTAIGRRRTEQNRITIMLIIVVIVFLVCQFPYAVLLLYGIYLDSNVIMLSPNGMNRMRIAGNIVNLLVLINASINFVLYSVMSTKFRKLCYRMFWVFGAYRREPATDGTSYNGQWWLRDSDLPLRFRSVRRSDWNEPTSSIGPSRPTRRSVHFSDKVYEKRLTIAPSVGTIQSTSGESSNETSDVLLLGDETVTPILLRTVSKARTNGSNPSQIALLRSQSNAGILDETMSTETSQLFQSNVLEIQMTVKHLSTTASPCVIGQTTV